MIPDPHTPDEKQALTDATIAIAIGAAIVCAGFIGAAAAIIVCAIRLVQHG